MHERRIIFSFCAVLLLISVSQGADVFESFLLRLHCYGTEQPGCCTEFTDAHPKLAWSYTNLTKADTHFYMFTKCNPDKPELMHKCGGELPPDTKFNPKCRTHVIMPGFISGVCNFAIYREIKDQILESGCYNVLLVDWMWGNSLDLVVAKKNLPIVAKQIAVVVKYLKDKYCLGPDDFIYTGQSYGAHMAGMVANIEHAGIINGIEPAGVLAGFGENDPEEGRLDAGDAPCVNVIHTNAGQCLPMYFGVNYTCGTADYWFNNGLEQESCYRQILLSFLKGDWFYGTITVYLAACYHLQSLYYYKASLNPTGCQFTGLECDSAQNFYNGRCVRDCGAKGEKCAIAGAYACQCRKEKKIHKNYYINTVDDCPYCDNSTLVTKNVHCDISAPITDHPHCDCQPTVSCECRDCESNCAKKNKGVKCHTKQPVTQQPCCPRSGKRRRSSAARSSRKCRSESQRKPFHFI